MKIIGILLIFFGCVLGGFSFSSAHIRRAEQLDGIRGLISFIGGQIDGFRMPLDKIFLLYKNYALEKCGFCDALRNFGWQSAKNFEKLMLTNEERRELEDFFYALSSCNCENAVRLCSHYDKRFFDYAKTAREEAATKSRLCRSVGILIGIMVTVLLI